MNPEELLTHSDFVQNLARRLVLDEHHAADVTQDTWLAALKNPPALGKPVRNWLSTVIRNITINLARGEKRRAEREKSFARPDSIPDSSKMVEKLEIRGLLIRAVLNLKEPFRIAIILRYYEGMSSREISKHLGLPLATVRTRIHRGVKQLKEDLKNNRDDWRLALFPLAGLTCPTINATAAFTGVLAMTAKFKVLLASIILIGVMLFCWFLGFETQSRSEDKASVHGALIQTEKKQQEQIETVQSPQKQKNDKIALKPSTYNVALKGSVFTRKDAAPVENARLIIHPLPFSPDTATFDTTTNKGGEFLITIPAQKPCFMVSVKAQGFKDLEAAISGNPGDLVMNCGSYYLEENEIHTILITDHQGGPVSGAHLSLTKIFANGPFLEKVSDSRGCVKIPDQEVERKTWLKYRTILQVKASGMADYFHIINDSDNPHFPSEIRMSPEGVWRGRVLDEKTGKGIWGARISLVKRRDVMSEGWPEAECVKTGDLGEYAIKSCVCYPSNHPRFYVWAKGYESRIFEEKIPEEIFLCKLKNKKRGLVVHRDTGQPLAGLKLQIMFIKREMRDEGVTDHLGYFDFPVLDGEPTHLQIKAQGYRRYRIKLVPEIFAQEEWIIPLKPMVHKKLTVKVRDQLNRPVKGAMVQNRYCEVIQDLIYTNHRGEANFSMDLFDLKQDETPTAEIYITRTGFRSLKPPPVALNKNPKQSCVFVLERGALFQNIKVLDEKGAPWPMANLSVQLYHKNGESEVIISMTDKYGFCNLGFPEFQNGVIFVKDRADAAIYFTYQSLLKGEGITLVVPNEVAKHRSIQGRWTDPSGYPISGIHVFYSAMDALDNFYSHTTSNKDGNFLIKTFKDKLYRVFFHLFYNQRNGFYYVGEGINNIKPGSQLDITLTPCTGIEVKLYALRMSCGPSNDFKSWLEDESGSILKAKHSMLGFDASSLYFIDAPEGRMRAVVETLDRRRFATSFFQVKMGSPVLTAVKEN